MRNELQSDAYWPELSARAGSLFERLSSAYVPVGSDLKLRGERLDLWRRFAAFGNEERFAKRLSWDKLEEDRVSSLLGDVSFPDSQDLPEWAAFLREFLESLPIPFESTEGDSIADQDKPFRFQEVWSPFVVVARERLKRESGEAYAMIRPFAHTRLEEGLLKSLCKWSTPTLELEFKAFLASRRSGLARLIIQCRNGSDNTEYREFVEHILDDGLRGFFHEYASLARILSGLLQSWIRNTSRFLLRLSKDAPELTELFDGGKTVQPVEEVTSDHSDRHRGGGTVLILRLSSGVMIVYKPKDVEIEYAYNSLLGYLNRLGVTPDFRTVRVLVKPGYGWVEFVNHKPCENRDEGREYFVRSGMLLALLYALRATDCHADNILANGPYPVLIDVETIMHPDVNKKDYGRTPTARMMALAKIVDSVMRVGLLPNWTIDDDGNVFDISALGGTEPQRTGVKVPLWGDANTDRCSRRFVEIATEPRANVARLDGGVLSPAEFLDDFIQGFSEMYLFLVEKRDEILAPGSPFGSLDQQQVRFVFRATREYAALLARSSAPFYMSDGIMRTIALESLGNTFDGTHAERPLSWPLYRSEFESLMGLDVPYFAASSGSRTLKLPSGEVLEDYFEGRSFELVVGKIRSLSLRDMQAQIAYIKASFFARGQGDLHFSEKEGERPPRQESRAPISVDECIESACKIARRLEDVAFHDEDHRGAAWLSLEALEQSRRYQLQPLDYMLYNGDVGIALFLAQLSRFVEDPFCRRLLDAALFRLRSEVNGGDEGLIATRNIGGGMGLGSIVYGLAAIAELLNDDALLQEAMRAASFITDEQVKGDRSYDVMYGAAGAILGLLKLYSLTKGSSVIATAALCGRHLIASRVASEAGFLTWETPEQQRLSGFSHGAAGIAYALTKLYDTTGDRDCLEAAKEAIGFERSLLLPDQMKWLPREGATPNSMVAWCNGETGIGLARLGMVASWDGPGVREEIDLALERTEIHGVQGVDHLCCGNFGRIEFLLTAGLRLARPDLVDKARKWAARVVDQASGRQGGYRIFESVPTELNAPGLFQGLAGIGYELLRLADPEGVPSVLLMD